MRRREREGQLQAVYFTKKTWRNLLSLRSIIYSLGSQLEQCKISDWFQTLDKTLIEQYSSENVSKFCSDMTEIEKRILFEIHTFFPHILLKCKKESPSQNEIPQKQGCTLV